jgi:subtilisin family serine protease
MVQAWRKRNRRGLAAAGGGGAALRRGYVPEWRFAPSGRAYPDVAAYAVHQDIETSETRRRLGGGPSRAGDTGVHSVSMGGTSTSGSTPIVAGLFSVLGSERQNAGKPPLGFLNPLIYQVCLWVGRWCCRPVSGSSLPTPAPRAS